LFCLPHHHLRAYDHCHGKDVLWIHHFLQSDLELVDAYLLAICDMHTAQTICISKQKSANFQVSKQQNLTLRPQDGTMFYTRDEKHKSQVREGLINSLHCGLQESILVYPKTSGISPQDALSKTDTFFCNKTRATCPVSYLSKTFLCNTHQIYRRDCREDSTKTLSRKFCASSSQIKTNMTRMTALILANVTQKVTDHCLHHQWQ
jgi:hypothetical protein